MAVTPPDLLEPTGDLTPELFPTLDGAGITALLTAYIADGTARVAALPLSELEKDRAVTAWAYSRAYRNIGQRLSNTPASFALEGEGSRTMLGEQLRTFKDSARRWEEDFDAVTATAPTPEEIPTATAQNRYVW